MINVTFNGNEKKRTVSEVHTFPCIGSSRECDIQVMFFSDTCGVTVGGTYYTIGSFRDDWYSNNFYYDRSGSHATINVTNN